MTVRGAGEIAREKQKQRRPGPWTQEPAGQDALARHVLQLKEVLESEGEISELSIIHGDAPDVEEFATLISDIVPRDQIRINQLGAVIGTHGGPRVLGVTYLVQ